mmetsp:Transcript_36661/g.105685  ORF Transcript_36661/g.105685 Transcript_36661/m.105685 type:complete len:393 (+) Transcript_36661:1219-2397(+)
MKRDHVLVVPVGLEVGQHLAVHVHARDVDPTRASVRRRAPAYEVPQARDDVRPPEDAHEQVEHFKSQAMPLREPELREFLQDAGQAAQPQNSDEAHQASQLRDPHEFQAAAAVGLFAVDFDESNAGPIADHHGDVGGEPRLEVSPPDHPRLHLQLAAAVEAGHEVHADVDGPKDRRSQRHHLHEAVERNFPSEQVGQDREVVHQDREAHDAVNQVKAAARVNHVAPQARPVPLAGGELLQGGLGRRRLAADLNHRPLLHGRSRGGCGLRRRGEVHVGLQVGALAQDPRPVQGQRGRDEDLRVAGRALRRRVRGRALGGRRGHRRLLYAEERGGLRRYALQQRDGGRAFRLQRVAKGRPDVLLDHIQFGLEARLRILQRGELLEDPGAVGETT